MDGWTLGHWPVLPGLEQATAGLEQATAGLEQDLAPKAILLALGQSNRRGAA
jgi:hypothetical protein